MDISKHASGDGVNSNNETPIKNNANKIGIQEDDDSERQNLTPEMIEDKEKKLKDRIAQCKSIIESLKIQLNEEKEKNAMEKKIQNNEFMDPFKPSSALVDNVSLMANEYGSTSIYASSVDKNMNYDENLMEYEKQLEKYQNTLNMAQNEKKIAIRKQMLAKAFKLKLLEVENQCNIELLRVKQSMQCLEPLQMIADSWKINSDSEETNAMYDVNNYALMPMFPELKSISGYDIKTYKEDLDRVIAETETANKDE